MGVRCRTDLVRQRRFHTFGRGAISDLGFRNEWEDAIGGLGFNTEDTKDTKDTKEERRERGVAEGDERVEETAARFTGGLEV